MYERILVPVDGSAASNAGLEEAIRLAALSGGTLRLLHVIEGTPYIPEAVMYGVSPVDQSRQTHERARERLDELVDRVARAGIEVDSVLIEGLDRHLEAFVADEVKSWPADVIVLGTHGRRGLGRVVLGSDAEQIVRSATVPVLLIRHDGASKVHHATAVGAGANA